MTAQYKILVEANDEQAGALVRAIRAHVREFVELPVVGRVDPSIAAYRDIEFSVAEEFAPSIPEIASWTSAFCLIARSDFARCGQLH